MKQIAAFAVFFFIAKLSLCQPGNSRLIFGKYEGIQIKYLAHVSDTSGKADRMNKTWGTKTLVLDSSGTFSLTFPVPYPTTRIYPNRFTTGKWERVGDTLILNTHYAYKDFIKAREKRTGDTMIRVSVRYTDQEKIYPDMDVIINKKTEATRGKQWVRFPLDTVSIIKIGRYAGPTSWEQEWLYRTKNSNSNYFKISVKRAIEGNNFVLEDYKLLITDSSLVQVKQAFELNVRKYKLADSR